MKRITFEMLKPAIEAAIAQGFRLRRNTFLDVPPTYAQRPPSCCPLICLYLQMCPMPKELLSTNTALEYLKEAGYDPDYYWGFAYGFDGKSSEGGIGSDDGEAAYKACKAAGFID